MYILYVCNIWIHTMVSCRVYRVLSQRLLHRPKGGETSNSAHRRHTVKVLLYKIRFTLYIICPRLRVQSVLTPLSTINRTHKMIKTHLYLVNNLLPCKEFVLHCVSRVFSQCFTQSITPTSSLSPTSSAWRSSAVFSRVPTCSSATTFSCQQHSPCSFCTAFVSPHA